MVNYHADYCKASDFIDKADSAALIVLYPAYNFHVAFIGVFIMASRKNCSIFGLSSVIIYV